MIRLVLDEQGGLLPDLGRRTFGRGAWIHPSPECLGRGVPKGAARSFRAPVTCDALTLTAAIRASASRRVQGLLSSAWRAGKLATGSSAAHEATQSGKARLIVVACDARAAAEASWVKVALSEGLVMAWGSKETLGAAVGRAEAGVVAVIAPQLSVELRRAIALAHLGPPTSRSGVPQQKPSTEVR